MADWLPDDVVETLAEQALQTRGRRPQDVMRAMSRLVEAEVGSPFVLSDAVIDSLLLQAQRRRSNHPTRAFVHLLQFELRQLAERSRAVAVA